jgi:FKBP-type peptidyl-prolyl cis-trans isomerase
MTLSLFRLPALAALIVSIAAAAGAQPPAPKPKTIPAPPDVAAPPADAVKTPSGLAYLVLQAGTGTEHPTLDDLITVNYTGWHTDGAMFDSSIVRGQPSTFPLRMLIKGWQEGLPLMVVGEKRRFWIPAPLAYAGRADRPQGMLVFDVELLGVTPAPHTPPDVAAPPADAVAEPSGLYSKVLQKGTGTEHPGKHSTVTVQYSGWLTSGRMFDSSVMRGEPATFSLDRVIKGWQEGVQLMVVGEKRRFWIPEKLAYRGQNGMPPGMLVFDVELLKIDKP